ncbi:hypothetical protein F5148DRAFT_1149550 [Russula earlei]|uniref:Uncharacterized protein n=1 Tax=Russula earlei TaxID=71964 RepID=A0ACC0U8U5_9AGAM|nr:hypothetical protein F5148DRAFT_1149550 [Russula earlei]
MVQAELQACETHLAMKERELDELQVSAVPRGLEVRPFPISWCGEHAAQSKHGLKRDSVTTFATEVIFRYWWQYIEGRPAFARFHAAQLSRVTPSTSAMSDSWPDPAHPKLACGGGRARMSMPVTPPGKAPLIPLCSTLRNYSPPPTQARNGKDRGDNEGSDIREMPEEELAVPAWAAVLAPPALSSTLAVPGQDGSDMSTLMISANGGPTRRKLIRVWLQPTFSPTPPMLDKDEDEDETWERSGWPAPLRSSSGICGSCTANSRNHHDNSLDDASTGRRVGMGGTDVIGICGQTRVTRTRSM